nr:MAG: helix-turn-helix domain protein [Bacteriophage sp.]
MLREDKEMTRAAFGQRLGVSGDVINNLERGRVEIKDHIVKLICAEYGVNEEWLRDGKEPMYIEPETFNLDEFARARGASDLELKIVKAYFELDPDIRKMLIEHFKTELMDDDSSDHPKTPEELEEQYPVEEEGSGLGAG